MIIYERSLVQSDTKNEDAAVAQSVERRIGSAEVTGPIPVSSCQESFEESKDFCDFMENRGIGDKV